MGRAGTPKKSHQGMFWAKLDSLSAVLENRAFASGHMASMIRPHRSFRHEEMLDESAQTQSTT